MSGRPSSLPFPVSLPRAPSGCVQDPLQNKLYALKSLSQGLCLGKPNLRTGRVVGGKTWALGFPLLSLSPALRGSEQLLTQTL